MLGFVVAAILALQPTGSSAPASAGARAWSHAPPSVQTDYQAAYRQGQEQGSAVLNGADASLSAAFGRCVGRTEVPAPWVRAAVGSSAIQGAAAAILLESKHLDRAALDSAWKEAPEVVRECTRANAQKVFGLTQATCADPKAPIWFVQRFSVSPQTERPVAEQLLFYYNAKAQDEWAEALIGKFVAQRPAPAT